MQRFVTRARMSLGPLTVAIIVAASVAAACWVSPLEWSTGIYLGLGPMAPAVPVLVDSYLLLALAAKREQWRALALSTASVLLGELHRTKLLRDSPTSLTITVLGAAVIAMVALYRTKTLGTIVLQQVYPREQPSESAPAPVELRLVSARATRPTTAEAPEQEHLEHQPQEHPSEEHLEHQPQEHPSEEHLEHQPQEHLEQEHLEHQPQEHLEQETEERRVTVADVHAALLSGDLRTVSQRSLKEQFGLGSRRALELASEYRREHLAT